MSSPAEVLATAFAALPLENRENLKWHAENGTRIACGASACEYANVSGWGAPSLLAVSRDTLFSDENYPRAAETVLAQLVATEPTYLNALAAADEGTVREAMRGCC